MPIRLDPVVAICDPDRQLHHMDKDKSLRVMDSSMNGGAKVKRGEQRSGVAAEEGSKVKGGSVSFIFFKLKLLQHVCMLIRMIQERVKNMILEREE